LLLRLFLNLPLTTATEEGYEVVCFLANVGQEEDWAAVEQKAQKIGAKKMIIEDLRKEFITELCFPAIRMQNLLWWYVKIC
jgi:argininosuccinate synthase